uniref:Plectin/eS10 N-terminal domain-containing protein n=1 Tax=Amphiprion percula TaxID=161767 RepID=A0A3P8TPI1_AMPPE
MVMPLADLRAIYELLFKDGTIVVLRAMASLKSRGYVRETFVWKHAYYYLTNEGIVYLRDYLHLPPEINTSNTSTNPSFCIFKESDRCSRNIRDSFQCNVGPNCGSKLNRFRGTLGQRRSR